VRHIAILFLLVLTAGCAATRTELVEVPTPVVIRDTVNHTIDRLDSVIIREYTEGRGDTVHHYHTTYRERNTRDTLLITRTDTVTLRVPHFITRETEAKRAWWERPLQYLGALTLLAAGVFAIAKSRIRN